jgi:multidrug efflux pump subunit AcrB
MIVLTAGPAERDVLKEKIRKMIAEGLPAGAGAREPVRVRPAGAFPVLFRVVGPDLDKVRDIAEQVRVVMAANPDMRDVHMDWGNRTPPCI